MSFEISRDTPIKLIKQELVKQFQQDESANNKYKSLNLDSYSLIQEINDTRFGHIYVMKSNQDVIQNHIIYVKQKNVCLSLTDLDDLKYRLTLEHPNLLKIYSIKDISGSDNIQIYFEEFITDLEYEMKHNVMINMRFNEDDLYNILLNIIDCLAYFENYNIPHENIIPSQILKIRNGKYKITDNFILNEKVVLFNQASKGRNIRYLAPELLFILGKDFNHNLDLHKCDIWSLGICILDAGTLVSADVEFVNRKEKTIDDKKLKQRIDKFQGLYGKKIIQILEKMLIIDPNKRYTAKQLLNEINKGTLKSVEPVKNRSGKTEKLITMEASSGANRASRSKSRDSARKSDSIYSSPMSANKLGLASSISSEKNRNPQGNNDEMKITELSHGNNIADQQNKRKDNKLFVKTNNKYNLSLEDDDDDEKYGTPKQDNLKRNSVIQTINEEDESFSIIKNQNNKQDSMQDQSNANNSKDQNEASKSQVQTNEQKLITDLKELEPQIDLNNLQNQTKKQQIQKNLIINQISQQPQVSIQVQNNNQTLQKQQVTLQPQNQSQNQNGITTLPNQNLVYQSIQQTVLSNNQTQQKSQSNSQPQYQLNTQTKQSDHMRLQAQGNLKSQAQENSKSQAQGHHPAGINKNDGINADQTKDKSEVKQNKIIKPQFQIEKNDPIIYLPPSKEVMSNASNQIQQKLQVPEPKKNEAQSTLQIVLLDEDNLEKNKSLTSKRINSPTGAIAPPGFSSSDSNSVNKEQVADRPKSSANVQNNTDDNISTKKVNISSTNLSNIDKKVNSSEINHEEEYEIPNASLDNGDRAIQSRYGLAYNEYKNKVTIPSDAKRTYQQEGAAVIMTVIEDSNNSKNQRSLKHINDSTPMEKKLATVVKHNDNESTPKYNESTMQTEYESAIYRVYEPVSYKVYEATNQPSYETVKQSVYETVTSPVYETVASPVYETVAQPAYETVAQPAYETVTQPIYEPITTTYTTYVPNSPDVYTIAAENTQYKVIGYKEYTENSYEPYISSHTPVTYVTTTADIGYSAQSSLNPNYVEEKVINKVEPNEVIHTGNSSVYTLYSGPVYIPNYDSSKTEIVYTRPITYVTEPLVTVTEKYTPIYETSYIPTAIEPIRTISKYESDSEISLKKEYVVENPSRIEYYYVTQQPTIEYTNVQTIYNQPISDDNKVITTTISEHNTKSISTADQIPRIIIDSADQPKKVDEATIINDKEEIKVIDSDDANVDIDKLKISEAIKRDPLLSKYLKSMYKTPSGKSSSTLQYDLVNSSASNQKTNESDIKVEKGNDLSRTYYSADFDPRMSEIKKDELSIVLEKTSMNYENNDNNLNKDANSNANKKYNFGGSELQLKNINQDDLEERYKKFLERSNQKQTFKQISVF